MPHTRYQENHTAHLGYCRGSGKTSSLFERQNIHQWASHIPTTQHPSSGYHHAHEHQNITIKRLHFPESSTHIAIYANTIPPSQEASGITIRLIPNGIPSKMNVATIKGRPTRTQQPSPQQRTLKPSHRTPIAEPTAMPVTPNRNKVRYNGLFAWVVCGVPRAHPHATPGT